MLCLVVVGGGFCEYGPVYFVASMFVLEFPDVLGEFSAVFAFSVSEG